MKAFVALTVANEIDGQNTVARAERVAPGRVKTEEGRRARPPGGRNQPRPAPPPQRAYTPALQPPLQVMDCVCQTHIIEIEVEDN